MVLLLATTKFVSHLQFAYDIIFFLLVKNLRREYYIFSSGEEFKAGNLHSVFKFFEIVSGLKDSD